MEQREARKREKQAEAERRAAEAARKIRRKAIAGRFVVLLGQLAVLHDSQRDLVAKRHAFEIDAMRKELKERRSSIGLRHSTELQLRGVESDTAISDLVYLFDKEYQQHRAEERQIEEEYFNQLRKYYEDKPNGNIEIIKARNELRRDLDKQFKEWDRARQMQLDLLTAHEKKKLDNLKAQHMDEVEDMEEKGRTGKLNWRINQWAEEMWIEGVVRERVNMLLAKEREELAKVGETV